MNPGQALPEIFVNGRFLTQRITGVQSFALGICSEMRQAGIPFRILVPPGHLLHSPPGDTEVIQLGRVQGHLWEQFCLPDFIRNQQHAVLLNLCNSAPVRLKHQVVTLHDLAFHHHPEWFSLTFRLWYNYMIPRAIRAAQSVLTVSGFASEEIQKAYGLPSEKIYEAHNKVDRSFLDAEAEIRVSEKICGKPFFLMVGSNDPRKNFSLAEQMISRLQGEAVLAVAGGSHQSFAKSTPSSSDRVIRLGYVTSGELKWLYQNAIALINPSRYEGFGIPNLEAMSQNCTVICSDIPVFREVCGDAAFYFRSDNADELKNQAGQVLQNPDLVSSKKMIGNSIFTNYQNRDRVSVILKALTR